MESHPVPKNVLDVEFKLFGSLSVRQFGKILGGSMAALLFYLLMSQLRFPALIAVPLMVVSVLLGVAAALIPSFETKFTGIMKSIFFSPRYVWRKQPKTPDILKTAESLNNSTGKKTASSDNVQVSRVPTIDDLSIDEILAARSTFSEDINDDPVSAQNFNRIYDQQFSNIQVEQSQIVRGQIAQPSQNTQSTQSARQLTPQPQPQAVSVESAISTLPDLDQIRKQIEKTRSELAQLNKLEGLEEQKQQLVTKLNSLLSQAGIQAPPRTDKASPAASVDVRAEKLTPLFGVIVDKSDNPIPEAMVKLFDLDQKDLGIGTNSGADGRFAMQVPSSISEVIAVIQKQGYNFHPFKLKLNQATQPAFKFRAH